MEPVTAESYGNKHHMYPSKIVDVYIFHMLPAPSLNDQCAQSSPVCTTRIYKQ